MHPSPVPRRLLAAIAALVLGVAACTGGDLALEAPPTASASPAPSPTPTPLATPPAPKAPPPSPRPIPEDRQALVERLQALVAAAGGAGEATLGVLVVDEHGRDVLAHADDQPLLPASTMKTVTAAAVLSTLGPGARLTTMVETTGPIDPDGTLHGDLVLVGGGDPVLATPEYGAHVYPARPRTPIEGLAGQLFEQGIRRVVGDVLGVAPRYDDDTLASGWPERYLHSFDARHIDGLTVDGGFVTLVTIPGVDDRSLPPTPVPDATAAATPTASPTPTGPPEVRVELASTPRQQAAVALAAALEALDVEITGTADDASDLPATVGRVARVDSPPLVELLRFTVQRSDNHVADTLFKVIGRVRTGEGSWNRGERALLQLLERFDIDTAGLRLADGSGLSRDNRLTARALVELDHAMTSGAHGATWVELMAVTGESGTLRDRLHGTPASGRFRGKTGTLNDVVAIHGMVLGSDGRYHLAVLGNEARGADRSVVRALIDEIVLALVADLDDCDVRPHPQAEPGPLGHPPSLVVCA